MREKEKIKIIYIAGSGFSGSTLMDLVLGSSENAFGLGEMKFLDNFLAKEKRGARISNFKDDSGEELEESFFWSPVVKYIKDNNVKVKKKEERIKLFHFLKILIDGNKNGNKKDGVLPILRERAREAKGEQIKFLIDSSKTLSRLCYLYECKNIDVYVIHLIRDGRGFLYSKKKRKNSLAVSFWEWIKGNVLISVFLFRCIDGEKKLRMGYDLFAKDPRSFIEKINNKFGLKIDPDNFLEKINQEKSYRFAGNSMRGREIKEIKTDRSWKGNFSFPVKLIISILTYIPNKIWVYGNK
jgi:hypothetical protein